MALSLLGGFEAMGIQSFIDAIIQLLIFSFIPFVFWYFKRRNRVKFLEWLGFKKPVIQETRKYIGVLMIDIILLFIIAFVIIPTFLTDDSLATSNFTGKGSAALLSAFFYAFIQTGLAEEIFFRGFLAKELILKFGLPIGNILQAFLFGCIHGLIFSNHTSRLGLFVITLATGFSGWLM